METVLVTGASSGIGKATARKLVEDGYTVYVAARRAEKMHDLAEIGAVAVQMDVTGEEDVRTVVKQIEAEHGGIDVLVNNAGFALWGAVEDISLEDARYQFDVNLFGLARLTQLALPYMREKGKGTVVNISSMGGRIWFPFGAWYHATKHALEGWSDCLRHEVAPFGVDVIVIEPGGVRTEFGDVAFGPLKERSAGGVYGERILGMMKRIEGSSRPCGGPGCAVTCSRAAGRRSRSTSALRCGRGSRPSRAIPCSRWRSDGRSRSRRSTHPCSRRPAAPT